jgi:hypothetical protein
MVDPFSEQLMLDDPTLSDIQSIRRKIYKFGCVVVRQFLPPADVAEFYDVTEQSFATSGRWLRILGIGDDEPLEHILDDRLRNFVSNVRIGQLFTDWFEGLTNGRSLYDLLRKNTAASDALARLLGSEWFPGATQLRRISPAASQQFRTWQQPIRMHCDGPSLSRDTYSINVWIPLVDCDDDTPGLQSVPGPFRPMQEAVRHDPATDFADRELEREQQELYTSGGDGRPRFVPRLQRGDVIIFHNWIMHATFVSEGMRKPRTSLELRFNAPRSADFENFAA